MSPRNKKQSGNKIVEKSANKEAKYKSRAKFKLNIENTRNQNKK